MTETNTEPKPDVTTKPTGISAADVRGSELFKSAMGRKQQELDAARAELAAINDGKAKAIADQEQKDLAAAGEYEKAAAILRAELQAERDKNARGAVERGLTSQLRSAGLTEELAIDGALSKYSGDLDGIPAYIAQLQEQNPTTFSAPKAPSAGALAVGSPSARPNNDWSQIKVDQNSKDPTVRGSAAKAIDDYVMANGGKLPPGFGADA